MTYLERCLLIIELTGLEYGLAWWATWLLLAALLVYLAGVVLLTVACLMTRGSYYWTWDTTLRIATWPFVAVYVLIWDR